MSHFKLVKLSGYTQAHKQCCYDDEWMIKMMQNKFFLEYFWGWTIFPFSVDNVSISIEAPSLEPLAHRRNVSSLSLFYRYYLVRCSSELAQLVPLPFSLGRSTRYSDFSVTICRCYKEVYVNSFFTCTAKLWNSQPIECFPLTYDLSGFNSRINRHLLTVGSF